SRDGSQCGSLGTSGGGIPSIHDVAALRIICLRRLHVRSPFGSFQGSSYGGGGGFVQIGYLLQGGALLAKAEDLGHLLPGYPRRTADRFTCRTGGAHSGLRPLADQVALELGDR